MALLEIRDLRVEYATPQGPLRAVDGVSLELAEPGQVLGIIGESGSGKTSLVRALTRTLPSNVARFEGAIWFEGTDLRAMPEEAFRREVRWRRIAVVFQGTMSAFNPVMRIGDQVVERLRLEGMVPGAARREAERLLATVGLPGEIARRYPHELSGGMKQRAAIAMALSLKPRLLVLDEPTSALDVSVQAQIMNLLKQLKGDLGLAMLFITHDIALASDLSDRIAVMHAGRIREEGSAEKVLLTPRDPYTRQLLESVPTVGSPAGQPGLPATTGQSRSLATYWAPRSPATEGRSRPPATVTGAPGPVPGRALLRTEGLKVRFQLRRGLFRSTPVRALEGVSLELFPGEVLAVVGESGSGKTTLGRATLGLVKPEEGRVLFGGEEVATLAGPRMKAFRRRAQAVFQDPYASLSPFMTVYELVEEPLRVHKIGNEAEQRARVLRALEQVGLSPAQEYAVKHPHNLSGGQRQRVSIARALVLEPEYLVADEPVSMVDASSRAGILQLLRELQRQRGLTVLYITHDIASARHFADRIAVLYLGTVVELGSPEEVLGSPLHPYTRSLLQAVPQPDPANRFRLRPVVPGEPPSATQVPPGCPFHPRCPEAIQGRCELMKPALAAVAGGLTGAAFNPAAGQGSGLSPGGGHQVACHLYEPGETAPVSGREARLGGA